jgi:alkylation response protein AidB-like acyl-CoA dehydrogenase
MQFTPNETQVMLGDSVRRFVEKDYKLEDSAPLGHNASVWAFFGEQGWLAAGLPESVGGLGGDGFDTCLIAQALGRGLVREAFVQVAAVAARTLLALDAESELLTGLLWGEHRPLLAHNEAAQRGYPAFVETTAKADGDGFVITGKKTALVGGPVATTYLITARITGDAGLSVFAVDADRTDLGRHDYRTIDNRGASNLSLDGVRVESSAIVGARGGADEAIAYGLDHGLVAAAAEAVGAMETALTITRDYLNTRKQFGVPIGDFQALRHKLADMFIETEQARSIVLRAVSALESDPAERASFAAAAKARVAKAGQLVGGHGIQLHGGIGVTEEYSIGHYYKRFVAFDLLMGAGAAHLERFAGL